MKANGLRAGVADIKGASLYYEIAGDGRHLVLVHAGFVDRRMWDEQFAGFAERYHVLRYDQRGFGNSRSTPGPFSHRGDLYELLKHLGIERAHLVGCSMGSQTIIDFALEHPEMAASLVLVSSAVSGYQFQGEMPKPLQALMAAISQGDVSRAAESAIQLWIAGPRRTPDQVDARLRERAREMSLTALPNVLIREEPLEPPAIGRLNELTMPTLVMVGELDDPSILEIGELLATQIRGTRKVMIPGAAHMPNMEKPEEFNHQVLAFLRR